MKLKRQCKYCNYCINVGRARAQGRKSYGRKYYYCEHKDACKLKEKYTGKKFDNFIGFGDDTFESSLKTKTYPRWCPLQQVNEKIE